VANRTKCGRSRVTTNLFSVLGVNTIRGRTFAENETQAVVLSYQYWESHFSSDPNVIGKALALDGKSYTVLGVAPADFEFPRAQHANMDSSNVQCRWKAPITCTADSASSRG